ARPPGRARRSGLRQSEPALHGPGVATDPTQPLPRERDPLALDEDRIRLLARRRRAVGLHRDRPAHARAARSRPPLPELRLPQRHARPPERLEREGAGRRLAPDLRRRRALRNPAVEGDPDDLVAADQALLVAALAEVRDPGLPPARVLLRLR